mmetsp:Transcript_30775/g.98424  ORF Transcript_30775/g.98424 Transcript_30775/m.98424 type:complete len:203 (-) Transcript_30775:498-1106(-)
MRSSRQRGASSTSAPPVDASSSASAASTSAASAFSLPVYALQRTAARDWSSCSAECTSPRPVMRARSRDAAEAVPLSVRGSSAAVTSSRKAAASSPRWSVPHARWSASVIARPTTTPSAGMRRAHSTVLGLNPRKRWRGKPKTEKLPVTGSSAWAACAVQSRIAAASSSRSRAKSAGAPSNRCSRACTARVHPMCSARWRMA